MVVPSARRRMTVKTDLVVVAVVQRPAMALHPSGACTRPESSLTRKLSLELLASLASILP